MKYCFRTLYGMALAFLVASTALPAAAQFATLRGQVVAASDGTPLQGVNVALTGPDGQLIGVGTGAEGLFVLRRITPGTYTLEARFIGFIPHTDTLTFAFGERRTLNIELAEDATVLGEMTVEDERAGSDVRAIAGLETIRAGDLARVPMPGVAPDLAAYLLTLPGIVSTGDQGGQLFVRGGTATQNLVLIDGIPLYQPFHIVGFYAAFPGNLVSYADVYAGGFGARYGGRISSVVDVAMRNGNKRRVVGSASLAPFLSTVHLEVPVEPEKVSLVASVRESVIERVSPDLLGERLPFRFGDRFVKLHAFLNRTSNFSATMIHSFDEGDIQASDETTQQSTWSNFALGGRYFFLPDDFPAAVQLSVYGTRLLSEYSLAEIEERRSDVQSYNMEIAFTYLLGDSQVNIGMFAGSSLFNYRLERLNLETKRDVSSGGLYLSTGLQLTPTWFIEPGLRMQSFTSGIGTAFDPRVRIRFQPGGPTGRTSFSAAWGIYHQQIIGITNDQSVTDVFTAWAPAPKNSRLPKAQHYILGVRSRLLPWLDLSLEGYYKPLTNIFFPRFSDRVNRLVALEQADGKAQGVDVRLEAGQAWFFGEIGYSLSYVEYEMPRAGFDGTRLTGTERFNPPHDRRHQLNVLAQVHRAPYTFSVRWQFGSGLPFTQINGFYNRYFVLDPDDEDFFTQEGQLSVSRAERYAERLPPYHRLDVSAERVFDLSYAVLTLQAGVINAYDRANIFDYNAFENRRINQLPLIPSVGLRVEVK